MVAARRRHGRRLQGDASWWLKDEIERSKEPPFLSVSGSWWMEWNFTVEDDIDNLPMLPCFVFSSPCFLPRNLPDHYSFKSNLEFPWIAQIIPNLSKWMGWDLSEWLGSTRSEWMVRIDQISMNDKIALDLNQRIRLLQIKLCSLPTWSPLFNPSIKPKLVDPTWVHVSSSFPTKSHSNP